MAIWNTVCSQHTLILFQDCGLTVRRMMLIFDRAEPFHPSKFQLVLKFGLDPQAVLEVACLQT